MNQLFCAILKDEPSLVLQTQNNEKQIILVSELLPTQEADFKKFFKVTTIHLEHQNKMQVCIGCHVLSNHSLSNIKFCSPDGNFVPWLKCECIFLESDSLGIDCPVTIGYFTKITPTLTHLTNFCTHIINQLMLVDINAETAIDLAPHLKQEQLDAMSNGDDFIPILPEFKTYRMHISHGHEPSQVSTKVIGIKCTPKHAKLLREFVTRMAAITSNDQHDGIFHPKGTTYLLGQDTYAQVLQENNFFLTTVAMIPVNLAYDMWFEVIDPHHASADESIFLHDHLLCKPWFLHIKLVTPNKCLIVTTHKNLPEACTWIDANLELLIHKSISDGIELHASLLP